MNKKLRILFCNRKDCFSKPGGDTIQMLNTKKYLERDFSVDVKIVTQIQDLEKYIHYFDLIHIFNIQTVDESLAFAKLAKNYKKKILLSTIFWDLSHSTYVNTLNKVFGINSYNNMHKKLFPLFNKLVKIWGLFFDKPYYYSKKYKAKIRELLNISDLLLPNSFEELILLSKVFGLSLNELTRKSKIVINAVDEDIFRADIDNSEEKDKSIICIGRIEPIKNQINVVKALFNDVHIKIIFVGKPTNAKYFLKLKELSVKRGNVEIIPKNISQKGLVDFLKKAKVHVLPSFRESPGLATLEALSLNLNVVVSNENYCPINTYFSNLINKKVFIADPYDVNSIKTAIVKALNSEYDYHFYSSNFNFFIAAKQTYEAYLEVINL